MLNSITDSNPVNPSLAKANAPLSQDDFIKILLAQMRLQTPENPFDSNTMMQQMAQLTNLSATKDMEAAVKNLNSNLSTSQVLNASQLIGKKVEIANECSPLIAGEGLKGSISLANDAEKIHVNIYDLSNKLIKTIDLGSHF